MEDFQDLLNRFTKDGFRQALDADGNPMPGTSMGVPAVGGAIPGTMVGNMQGVLQGVVPQLQGVLKGGVPAVPQLQGVLKGGVPAVPQLYGPVLIPRRLMSIFESFLNRLRGNNIPSQMPGAMGGGFGHGIDGNVADIQQMPYRYGDQTGGIQQMPHIYGQQGGFNIINPFTYGNMKRAIEGTRAGDKNMEYSDSPAGQIGKAANERNRLIQEMLGGY